MDMGGVPGGGGVNPPQAGAVAAADGDHPNHVATRGDTKGYGVDDPSPESQG